MRVIQESGKDFDELISPEQLAAAVQSVAERINHDYEGKEVLFLCILNGAFIYAADLVRKVNLPCDIQFVRLKSYEGTHTSGEVQVLTPLPDVIDKDIIIIEDIVDTGTSMHFFKRHLKDLGAHSVRLTSIVFKSRSLQYEDARPDYIGLDIPGKFIIGYGLDWNDHVRNLDAIYTLRER